MITPSLGSSVCLSGGADGADLMWGMAAASLGHTVIHWSFAGHRSRASRNEVVQLSPALLDEASPHCLAAARSLRKYFPPKSSFTRDLLRRNWFQVRDAEACYAVASLKDGLVQGGTGWAVAMFLNRFGGDACPCYVFCQDAGRWFEWQKDWQPIYEPPAPTGVWAGIGSRDLSSGRLAIKVLMNWRGCRDRVDVRSRSRFEPSLG